MTQPDNQTLDITIDLYYLRYLKDTNSLQLNLVPSTEWYDDNLEFDWEIVSLSRTQMQIQLNFRDPIYISSSWEPDKIQISFHNTEFWLRTDDRYQFALPEGYFLQEDLPPQKASTVTIPAEITYYVGSAFVTLNILMNWILYIDVNDVWSMVNSFQISSKLPLFNFPISENNLLWFSAFRKISSFEYLPNEWIYSESFAITKTETWSKSFDWMGYSSTNFMLLLSSQWLYYLVVVT